MSAVYYQPHFNTARMNGEVLDFHQSHLKRGKAEHYAKFCIVFAVADNRCDIQSLQCCDDGAFQKRERVIMVCSRDGAKLPFLLPTRSENGHYGLSRWRTVRQAFEGRNTPSITSFLFPKNGCAFTGCLNRNNIGAIFRPVCIRKH